MSADLHKLGHLVAVAEEGSLTRAATREHLSQQALSASIRALEREVGVGLLSRQGRTVALTPAGRGLVEDARVLRGMAETAVRRARRTGRGEAEVLRIGHTPAVTGEEVVSLVAPVTGLAHEAHQRYPSELTGSLLAGALDLGLCRGMTPPPGLHRATLGHQRLHLALDAGHRLADRRGVALTELAGETLLVWGRPGNSGYTDLLLDRCRRAGFEPRVERTTRQGTPPVTAVVGTDHCALVTAPPGPAAGGRARVLPVDPPIHAPLYALFLPHAASPARDAFLAQVRVGEASSSGPTER